MQLLPQGFPSTSSRRLAVELAVPKLRRSIVKKAKKIVLHSSLTVSLEKEEDKYVTATEAGHVCEKQKQ